MSTITAKELATRLDTDAKTCRRFLRSEEGLNAKVGKGHRWAIEAREVRGLKARFGKWVAADLEAKADRAKAKAIDANAVLETAEADGDDANEVLELDAPTDDELLAIEAGDENADLED